MNSLKVQNWQDWEDICKYYMQYLIKKRFDVDIKYVGYGSRGQKQHGIDIIPSAPKTYPIVAQCKHISGKLEWKTIEAELKKTDQYPNEISNYFVITTGTRDTSVQNALNAGSGIYFRPNNKSFNVHVLYFEDFTVQDFIPEFALNRFFPDVFNLARTSRESHEARNSRYIESLEVLKTFIPTIITRNDLNWLERWDFSSGFVIESDYGKFKDLYIEYNRTLTALAGIPDWLHENNRDKIAKSLLAGDKSFDALTEFVNSISNNVIGANIDGNSVLLIDERFNSIKLKTTNEWTMHANYLAQIYRQYILGTA